MSLELIQDTVQRVANAITAALDLETEIVDDSLKIIGGTGRYADKTGEYEENGDINGNMVYANCLRSGSGYITIDSRKDKNYGGGKGELAEICTPVKAGNVTLGIIGLIAFDEQQRQKIIDKTSDLMEFLRIMAELIADAYLVDENRSSLEDTLFSLISDTDEGPSLDHIISVSRQMENVKMRALQVAQSDSAVLISGDSGIGKSLLARSIHRESNRADAPFITVNCTATPDILLESELFGYEKTGAGTGEKWSKPGKLKIAGGGTIFLDEVGDMPLHIQEKFLSALRNRKIYPVGSVAPVDVNVRVIAATCKSLEKMIREKKFRKDLYFYLNVIPIYIPPLRERPDDIDVLLDHITQKFAARLGKDIRGMTDEARRALNEYSWPGNVREIENVIEYAVNMEDGEQIHLENLPENILLKTTDAVGHDDLKSRLASAERKIIEECLEQTGKSLQGKREAAKMLGISESTLYRRLRALELL